MAKKLDCENKERKREKARINVGNKERKRERERKFPLSLISWSDISIGAIFQHSAIKSRLSDIFNKLFAKFVLLKNGQERNENKVFLLICFVFCFVFYFSSASEGGTRP